MVLELVIAGFFVQGATPLETARDRQDRPSLERFVRETDAAAAKAPNDAAAQYRCAMAASYLAEVDQELRDKKAARQAAEVGIKAAERAVALKPDDAENYRVLGTLCGQAITDLMSGLTYGPRAKDAIAKAVARAPNSSMVYVARGVGNYYLPPQLGGGLESAVVDFRKAIDLDSRNAEAYLWLGLSLRKENKDAEARQAFEKSLALNPNSLWVKQQLSKTPAK
ncbi:MAG: tetratricopeptide repeat protein [Bryobacteraceae bacterium]|jgi:tetratricopeptide (TPR) repeat protein